MRPVIAALKLLVFAVLTILIFLPQPFIVAVTRGPAAHYMPRIWGRMVCAVMRIRVRIIGTPAGTSVGKGQPVLYIGNHLSNLDIPLLGGALPDFCFVAKNDVAGWPIFGYLGGLAQTAYVSRRPQDSRRVLDQLETYHRNGQSLLIFGEGTTTDGARVEPIKSSPLSITACGDGKGYDVVQPFTLRLREVNGKRPETFAERIIYAWPREVDSTLAEHMWHFAYSRGAAIDLVLHPPLQITAACSRKELAKELHQSILSGLTHDQTDTSAYEHA